MRNKLTKNIGLKIISLLAAFLLWLVVVNVDDPVISRTYTGIQVEILNANVIEEEGKCYEILDNSDVINVVVTAQRSVLDEMSKDYIKATADFSSMTFLDSVPIEVKSTRYADKIDSVATRTENLKVKLEDVVAKTVPLIVDYEGTPESGYVIAGIESNVTEVEIKGPKSVIDEIDTVDTDVDIEGINKDTVLTETIKACDTNKNVITDERIVYSANVAEIKFVVNPTKQIPISCGYSGEPVNGFAPNGINVTNPSSVLVTGRGENFDDIDVIYISPDDVSIEGAAGDVTVDVDITDYLPTGVEFADEDFNPTVTVIIGIEPTVKKTISIPLANITVENVPEGYVANIVDVGGFVDVEIQGLGDTFDRYSGDLAIGSIDATTLVPRNVADIHDASLTTGENDGLVVLDLPTGITVTTPVSLMVIVESVEDFSNEETSESKGSDDAS